MMYRCIKKLKREGLFKTIWVDEEINQRTFDLLSTEEKTHFDPKSNLNESIVDQFEENQEADDAADKN